MNDLAPTEAIETESMNELISEIGKLLAREYIAWISHRLGNLQEILEKNTSESALLLRRLLGPITLTPVAAGHWQTVLPALHQTQHCRDFT